MKKNFLSTSNDKKFVREPSPHFSSMVSQIWASCSPIAPEEP